MHCVATCKNGRNTTLLRLFDVENSMSIAKVNTWELHPVDIAYARETEVKPLIEAC